MSHEVETMAYTNEVPWHGLGVKVDGNKSPKEMLKAAGLDWKVERRPIYHGTTKKTKPDEGMTVYDEINGFAALVRDKDNAVFDIVGSQYKPVQNEQAFEFFNEFIKAGKAKMETAGSLRGGRYVWGLANLNASFKLRGDDVVKGYLLCCCPHEQGKSMIFKFTPVRVVCNNTLTLSLREASSKTAQGKQLNEYRRTHRSEFDDLAIEMAKDQLGIARDQLGEFEKNARKLQSIKMTTEKTLRILLPVFSAGSDIKKVLADFDKEASPKVKILMDVLSHAPGAQPDNAWGVLNAATYYADHIASRSADKRLANAWLGKTASQKEAVLDALLKL